MPTFSCSFYHVLPLVPAMSCLYAFAFGSGSGTPFPGNLPYLLLIHLLGICHISMKDKHPPPHPCTSVCHLDYPGDHLEPGMGQSPWKVSGSMC